MSTKGAKFVFPLLVIALSLGACSGGADGGGGLSKEEERNFKQGMNAEKTKEVGPAPTPPPGPLKAYEGGSAADKALGR